MKDIRPNGNQSGALEVELKISDSEIPNDAKVFRITVLKAVDDTGLDLATPEASAPDFKSVQANKIPFKAKLKNPARKASFIKELSGNVELFVPQRDQSAAVVVGSFRKHLGKPIESDTLKMAGVEITVRTGEQYEALKKKQEVERMEAVKKPGSAWESSFRSAGFGPMAPNDVAVSIKDANHKLAGFEFRDSSDTAIQPIGSGTVYTVGSQGSEHTVSYHFRGQLPETAKLVVFIATPEAVLKSPFTLANVALP